MRAVVYDRHGPPAVMALRLLPAPVPGPGAVLVAVEAATVAPGDCKTRAGLLQGFFTVAFPKVPGRYGAGTVVALGEGVAALRIGEPVVIAAGHAEAGTCAEQVVRPVDAVAVRPASLSAVDAVAVVHEGVCAQIALVEVGAITAGQRVLIHGAAGAVGGACVQLARHLGAHVIATCRSVDEAHVRDLGAAQTVAFDRTDFAGVIGPVDVVIDTLGGDIHERSCRVLVPGGRLVHFNAAPFVDRGADFGVKVLNAKVTDDAGRMRHVMALASAGVFRPRVARVLPLDAVVEAHRLVETGTARRGRVVLDLTR